MSLNDEGKQEEVVVATEPEQVQEEAPKEQPNESGSDDAAFEAGFNSANGVETSEPEPQPEPEPEQPKLIAGMTEEQIKELVSTVEALKARESKIFGSFGSLKQTVDAMRQQQPSSVSFSPDKLKRLSQEFPEIANILAEDLKEAIGPSQGVAPDLSQFESKIETRIAETQRAYETKLLTVMHRDWKDVVASEEFSGWKETLDPKEREELDNSWDASYIGERISAFKDWKAKSQQTKQTNQKRLEAAVAPKTAIAPKPLPTEIDAFLSGFKAVRG